MNKLYWFIFIYIYKLKLKENPTDLVNTCDYYGCMKCDYGLCKWIEEI